MFGIIADILASIITILFPVFASYKALRASDLAQLTPWLIYWIVLSLILLVESWTAFILGWLPFYSWIRLLALSYLVLPQTQGAKLLYTNYVEPFIASHERQIEMFISDLHDRGSRAGIGYLKRLIDLIRQRVFGLPPTTEEPRPPPTAAGYAQSLLSRFAMPAAHAPSTSDFYSMLSGAVAAATTSSSPPTSRSASGTHATDASAGRSRKSPLIPSNITTTDDKQSFLTSQREKLAVLMKALDHEQRELDLAHGKARPRSEKSLEADIERRMRDASRSASGSGSGHDEDNLEMRKNKSDNSFQNIEADEFEDAGSTAEEKKRQDAGRRTTSGGWNPATWFSSAGGGAAAESRDDGVAGDAAKAVRDAVQGMSSSIDRRG